MTSRWHHISRFIGSSLFLCNFFPNNKNVFYCSLLPRPLTQMETFTLDEHTRTRWHTTTAACCVCGADGGPLGVFVLHIFCVLQASIYQQLRPHGWGRAAPQPGCVLPHWGCSVMWHMTDTQHATLGIVPCSLIMRWGFHWTPLT